MSMNTKWVAAVLTAAMISVFLLSGCGQSAPASSSVPETETQSISETETQTISETDTETSASEQNEETQADEAAGAAALEDGEYAASFQTDGSMFHVNEACEGLGKLTVENGEMRIHISLTSRNIVNLFPGTAQEAQEAGAQLLEPTVDSVTYSDGTTEEVNGFDVPVPAIGEEFDLALIGTKGKWYDHKVIVSDPVPGGEVPGYANE